MFESYSYKKKFIALILIFCMLSVAAYRRSFKSLIEAYKENKELKELSNSIKSKTDNIDGLRNKVYQYDKFLGNQNVSNDVIQQEIISFSTDLKEHIKILNLEWLKKYFKVEEKDELVLSNPQEEIIDKGGLIFYARYNGEIIGTVSLMKVDNTTFELSKMAVSDQAQGLGVGNKLLTHCMAVAKENNIKKLFLYSNRILLPALHLYQKFGFTEVPLGDVSYERADIKMEKILL